jgi:hypothetical protein
MPPLTEQPASRTVDALARMPSPPSFGTSMAPGTSAADASDERAVERCDARRLRRQAEASARRVIVNVAAGEVLVDADAAGQRAARKDDAWRTHDLEAWRAVDRG